MRRTPLALIAALVLITLPAACADAPAATPVPSTATAPATATGAPSPAPTSTPLPTTSATPEPVASTADIPTAELPRVLFDRDDGSSVALPVEVPPRAEYSIGLSGRSELEGRGMLFYYPDGVGNAGFWMRDTHVDLAIAFVGVDGVITEIHEMSAESLEITRPLEPYEFAVEAPAEWFAMHDVRPGDRMRLDFALADIPG